MDAAAKAGPAAEQWEDIRRFTYGGLACYAALLALSVACDATASYFSRSAYRAGGRRRVLPRFMALRYKMRNFYRNTSLFYYIAIARFALNTVVCVLYVAGTYRRSVTRAVGVVYRVFGGVFTVDLLVRVSSAESALIDAASVPVFFQAMSLPSMFLARGATGFLNFSFLRALTAYESYRAVTRRIDLAVAGHNKRFVIGLVAKTCTLVYLLASGVQLLELPGDVLSVSFLNAWHALGDWHFLNAVYFVVVTLTTVGYGDFSPVTLPGRLFVIVMMFVGAVVVTDTVSHVMAHMSRARGTGSFVKRANSRHVIVCGNPQLSDLVRFTSEFYAKNRISNSSARVVVLVEKPSWTHAEWFHSLARSEFLKKRVESLAGSVRSKGDLSRAQLATADAVFILATPSNGVDPATIDMANVMDILAIRNNRTDIPIYTTVLLKRSLAQTRIAQSAPASVNDPDLLFRGKMHGKAQYHGLRREMLEVEALSLPTHMREDAVRRALSSEQGGALSPVEILLGGVPHVVTGSQDRKQGPPSTAEAGGDGRFGASCDFLDRGLCSEDKFEGAPPPLQEGVEDLARSSSICLQDVHAAVMAAHVKANGVGTLVTNMVLDINPKSSPDEPAWLSEYHAGAMCELTHLVIPPQLDNVRVDDVAVLLYDHGLVLMTTSRGRSGSDRTLVLDPSTRLRKGDIGMFLTYHRPRYASPALMLAALKLEADESVAGEGHALDDDSAVPRSASPTGRSHYGTQAARGPADGRPAGGGQDAAAPADDLGPDIGGSDMGDSDKGGSDTGEPDAGANPVRAGGGAAREVAGVANVREAARPSRGDETPGAPTRADGGRGSGLADSTSAGEAAEGGASGSRIPAPEPRRELPPSQRRLLASEPTSPPPVPRSEATAAAGDPVSSDDEANMPYYPVERGRSAVTTGSGDGAYLGIDIFDPLVDLSLLTRRSDGYIPDGIDRHIIIVIEGVSALQNLPLLAKYLWRVRRRRGTRRSPRPKIPLIVICPVMTGEVRSSFAAHDGKCLFFLGDHPSSRASWRRARLHAAKGVIMLADYALPWQESDARTIFSLMTLDSFIKSDQDVFVVAELVEEKSLEFLREPMAPRRVGVDHGDEGEDDGQQTEGVPSRSRSVAGGPLEHDRSSVTQPSRLSVASSADQPLLRRRLSQLADKLGRRAGGAGDAGGDHSGRLVGGAEDGDERALFRSGVYNKDLANPSVDGASAAAGQVSQSELFRARRGVLLSRSRYASGDLLLPSESLSLLVREYLEPGFVHFYTELLGAGRDLGALKIRLVRVPPALFDSPSSSMSCADTDRGRCIVYRELFVRLMRLGATPIGLYRSGAAPVRVPTRNRCLRGADMEAECLSFVRSRPCSLSPTSHRHAGGEGWVHRLVQRAGELFRDIQPQAQLERRAVDAWHLSSSGEPDQSSDSTAVGGEREADPEGDADAQSARRLTRRGNLPDRQVPEDALPPPSTSFRRASSIRLSEAGRGNDLVAGSRRASTMSKLWDAAATPYRKTRRDAGTMAGPFLPAKAAVGNVLPYVLTMPEPFTLVSQRDGVYILCDTDFELPRSWGEGYAQGRVNNSSGKWTY